MSVNRQVLIFPGVLLIILILLQVSGLANHLALDRSLVAAGQWWRLLTSSFVHLNTNHLMINVIAYLLVVLSLQGRTGWPAQLLCIVTSALVGGVYVFFDADSIGVYYGFSGVLHGLVVFYAINLRREAPVLAWLVLVGVIAKVVYETQFGASAASEALIEAAVVVESHQAGALAGGLTYALMHLVRTKRYSQAIRSEHD